MPFGPKWSSGNYDEFAYIDAAWNAASPEQLEKIVDELDKWDEKRPRFMNVLLEALGVGPPISDQFALVQERWFGQDPEKFTHWRSDARRFPTEIQAIIAKTAAAIARARLENPEYRCETLGQCEWPEFKVRVALDPDAEPAPAIRVWVFGPDNMPEEGSARREGMMRGDRGILRGQLNVADADGEPDKSKLAAYIQANGFSKSPGAKVTEICWTRLESTGPVGADPDPWWHQDASAPVGQAAGARLPVSEEAGQEAVTEQRRLPSYHGSWWENHKSAAVVPSTIAGRYTRLLPPDPMPVPNAEALAALAAYMTEVPADEVEKGPDPNDDPVIPAAYTFFGQFVDHDITFDPVSHLRTRVTPDKLEALVDFRTPRLDLDCLYGRGPADQPYLYMADALHLAEGERLNAAQDAEACDLPRSNGRALIGDPRNDENRVISQLHAAMIRFHNRVVDDNPGYPLEEVQQIVRHHYQWVVLHDFLPKVIHENVFNEMFPAGGVPQFRFRSLANGLAQVPIEFAVAAYRFGHSMVRDSYRLDDHSTLPLFAEAEGDEDLAGFRPLPASLAIDWRRFINLDTHAGEKLQRSYRMDASVAASLGRLPARIASAPASLPMRTLQRGVDFQVASGEQVASALRLPCVPRELVMIGADRDMNARPISAVDPLFEGEWDTPLWPYVLAEARAYSLAVARERDPKVDVDHVSLQLGPVGGHIVGEVIIALLAGDPTSIFGDFFRPDPLYCRGEEFGLAQLLNASMHRTP
jgi:hypothetical protein